MKNEDTCKPLEEMTLMDHFMFEEVMENPENTKLMLEIILEDDIILKDLPQTEKELRKQPTNRLARLDIWTKDIKDNIYDTELQNQKVPNLSKRTRYYQAMIDCKLLAPGEKDFNQLNNVYIILIAPFDMFGYGLYRYTFIGQCVEIPELKENIKTMLKDTEYSVKYLRFREAYYREHKDEIEEKIAAGAPWTLRLKSPGNAENKCFIDDMIKGKIEMPENVQDIVLLKSDGIPTYHFAHAVDDHLMRTTHVVRGDEWMSSCPVHLQLFKCLGFKVPKYAHVAPIMKEENGGKRKLSKRKDPEAAVTFYVEQGYPKESVNEYIMTLMNSNFEDWRKTNKDASIDAFPFNLKKMSVSGALFDMVKLNDVSKNVISLMNAETVYKYTAEWACEYDKDFYELLIKDPAHSTAILNVDRDTPKPRKDIACWSEVKDYISYYFDELFENAFEMPENITSDMAKEILEAYIKAYNENDTKDEWFQRMKDLCEPLGYTPNVKEYKKNPEMFKGHVGDVSTVVRVAVTGRRNTPDLYSIMSLLGKEKVMERLNTALDHFSA